MMQVYYIFIALAFVLCSCGSSRTAMQEQNREEVKTTVEAQRQKHNTTNERTEAKTAERVEALDLSHVVLEFTRWEYEDGAQVVLAEPDTSAQYKGTAQTNERESETKPPNAAALKAVTKGTLTINKNVSQTKETDAQLAQTINEETGDILKAGAWQESNEATITEMLQEKEVGEKWGRNLTNALIAIAVAVCGGLAVRCWAKNP